MGTAPFRMLVMPKDVHPILPPDHPGSIVDPVRLHRVVVGDPASPAHASARHGAHPPPPTPLSPQAASGIYFRDYLKLLDRLALTEEFAVYVAQLNLLRLPSLLRQVCLIAPDCSYLHLIAPDCSYLHLIASDCSYARSACPRRCQAPNSR